MDLILWRHAEAEDELELGGDLARRLTPKGEKQASRMASWLDTSVALLKRPQTRFLGRGTAGVAWVGWTGS